MARAGPCSIIPTQNSGITGETKKRRRTENLKPWKPGQSGNPGEDIASEIAQRVFEENAEAIEKAMLKALLKGDPKVFAVLADRAYGKLTLKVEILGLENLPDLIVEARKRRGGNRPVEHRFKPGQNGNPGGRRTGRLWGLSIPGHGGKLRHPDKTPTLTHKESL